MEEEAPELASNVTKKAILLEIVRKTMEATTVLEEAVAFAIEKGEVTVEALEEVAETVKENSLASTAIKKVIWLENVQSQKGKELHNNNETLEEEIVTETVVMVVRVKETSTIETITVEEVVTIVMVPLTGILLNLRVLGTNPKVALKTVGIQIKIKLKTTRTTQTLIMKNGEIKKVIRKTIKKKVVKKVGIKKVILMLLMLLIWLKMKIPILESKRLGMRMNDVYK